MDRIIGDYGNKSNDTLIFIIGGIHGNETSGVVALEKVFEELNENETELNGRFVGIRGNLKALKEGHRYIETDLNRLWSDELIEKALSHPEDNAEYQELAAIFQVLENLEFDKYKRKVFVDLHTTSAEDGVFVIVKDYNKSSFIVKHLHSPLLLGLETELKNTTIPYMCEKGFIAFGYEAGQIGTLEAVTNQLSTIWHTLERCECIKYEDIPLHVRSHDTLQRFTDRLPAMLKMHYSHKLKGGEGFKMEPGFRNFSYVFEGDLLATDNNGEIRAKRDGYLLMPLYQPEGNDGFFLIDQDGVDEYLAMEV